MKAREDFMDSTENSGEYKYREYIRAYYAGCALTGLCTSPIKFNQTQFETATMVVAMADALVAELNKK